MSANVYCWEPTFDPKSVAKDFPNNLDDFYRPPVRPPSILMLQFVDALLARYPDLDNSDDTVWAAGPLKEEITGTFINIAICWPRVEEGMSFVISTANGLGLHCYDPQSERFHFAPNSNGPTTRS